MFEIILVIILFLFLLAVIIQKLNIIIRKLENSEKADLLEDIQLLRDINIIAEDELEEKMPIALELQRKENLLKYKKAILNLKKHGILSNYEFRYKLDLLNLEYDKDENREKK